MEKDKFSFTIVANSDNWGIEDLDNITHEEAIKIAYIIEKERGISEVSCDDYFGENLYVEGDRNSDVIKVDAETMMIDDREITIYDNKMFDREIYQLESDNILDLIASYLDSSDKDDFTEIECDYLDMSSILDDEPESFNFIMDLSIKYWNVSCCISYRAMNTYLDETLKLTIDKTLNNK